MALFHFLFELVKIGILSCIYAGLVLGVFLLVAHFKPGSWFATTTMNGYRFWRKTGICISIALFVFMFTRWGNHGLGDESTLPVGHFNSVENSDGSYTYIYPLKGGQINIGDFTFDDDRLYASSVRLLDGTRNDFLVWDLVTDSVTFYETAGAYLAASQKEQYADPGTFEPFQRHYSRYWNRWRFWLLP